MTLDSMKRWASLLLFAGTLTMTNAQTPPRLQHDYARGYVQTQAYHDNVVEDYVYRNDKGGVGVADGVTSAGPRSAEAAQIVLEGTFPTKGLVDKLTKLYEKYNDNYDKIYRKLDRHAWKKLHPVIYEMTEGASTTAIAGQITDTNRLLLYQIGDVDCRVVRDGQIYFTDELYLRGNMLVSLRDWYSLPEDPLYTAGKKGQMLDFRAPEQLGSPYVDDTDEGYFAVHQLYPKDVIIFSSDGIGKFLTEKEILRIASQDASAQAISEQLVMAAEERIKSKGDDLGTLVVKLAGE